MAGQNGKGLFQIPFALIPASNRARPEFTLGCIGLSNRTNDGQGHFPLTEIIARILAHGPRSTAPIQKIINDLEGNAQRIAILGKGLTICITAPRQNGARLGGRLKQGGSLAADHLHIGVLTGGDIHRGGHLQNLALRNRCRRIGENFQNIQILRLNHQLKRARKQIIADQDRRFIIPKQIRSRTTTALVAFIDHIIMQERSRVDKLYGRGQFNMALAFVSAQIGRRQSQHRANTLSACINQMCRHLGNAWRVPRSHTFTDQLIHSAHFRLKMGGQTLMRFCTGMV